MTPPEGSGDVYDPEKRTSLTNEEKMFIAVVFAETTTDSNVAGVAVANVIMNRKNLSWNGYSTVEDIIRHTGFDPIRNGKPDQNFQDAIDYLNGKEISVNSGNNSELIKKYVDTLARLVLPVYYGQAEDITQGGIYFYAPKMQAEMHAINPSLYPEIPSFLDNTLE